MFQAHEITDYVKGALVESLQNQFHWMSNSTRTTAIRKVSHCARVYVRVVCVCVRACVRACVYMRVRRMCVRAYVCVGGGGGEGVERESGGRRDKYRLDE